MSHHDAEEHARYNQFIAELTALTRKCGIALTSIGGVHIAEDIGAFGELRYIADISSGDLMPDWQAI
ncbi:MAG: hypothetical protein ACOY82_04535 [Pseudomonadota bacterium]